MDIDLTHVNNINAVNRQPNSSMMSSVTITEGEHSSFFVDASDDDIDPLTFPLTSGNEMVESGNQLPRLFINQALSCHFLSNLVAKVSSNATGNSFNFLAKMNTPIILMVFEESGPAEQTNKQRILISVLSLSVLLTQPECSVVGGKQPLNGRLPEPTVYSSAIRTITFIRIQETEGNGFYPQEDE